MIIYYIIIINIIAFLLNGYDKLLAIKHRYRIPENVLLFVSFIGGSLGFIIGMFLFRHKIKKIKFIILEPIFLIFNLYLFLGVL